MLAQEGQEQDHQKISENIKYSTINFGQVKEKLGTSAVWFKRYFDLGFSEVVLVTLHHQRVMTCTLPLLPGRVKKTIVGAFSGHCEPLTALVDKNTCEADISTNKQGINSAQF